MKFFLFFIVFSSFVEAASWDGRIFNVKNNSEISYEEYITNLTNYNFIVLGEKHYTLEVQNAQAKTISDVVIESGKANAFTTGWEFLNVTEQPMIDNYYFQVKTKKITALNFVEKTQGKVDKQEGYAAIIDATAILGGKLLGTNLTRLEKKPVTERGIGALDPRLLPPNFDYGTSGYYQRFALEMQGHATPEQVKNYYASQCLVDDTIAYHLLKDSPFDLNFLIVGSFHSDYFDGAVNRIKVRNPFVEVATIKIIDASDYEESELLNLIHSDEYGDIADYVYFVNEPYGLKRK